MSNEKVETEPGSEPEQVELLDCGQASKTTHGIPFLLLFELGTPPFDRSLY